MGPYITALILILALVFVALLIYSKVKEIRGKDCSSCSGCEHRESCTTEQKEQGLDCQEPKDGI